MGYIDGGIFFSLCLSLVSSPPSLLSFHPLVLVLKNYRLDTFARIRGKNHMRGCRCRCEWSGSLSVEVVRVGSGADGEGISVVSGGRRKGRRGRRGADSTSDDERYWDFRFLPTPTGTPSQSRRVSPEPPHQSHAAHNGSFSSSKRSGPAATRSRSKGRGKGGVVMQSNLTAGISPSRSQHLRTGSGAVAGLAPTHPQGDLSALSLLAASELLELERTEAARRAEYESKHRDLLAAVASVGGHMPPTSRHLHPHPLSHPPHHSHPPPHAASQFSSGSSTPMTLEGCTIGSNGFVAPGPPPACHHDDCHKSYRSALKASSRLGVAAAARGNTVGLSSSLEEGSKGAFLGRPQFAGHLSDEGRSGTMAGQPHPPSPHSATESDLSLAAYNNNSRHLTQGGQGQSSSWRSPSLSSSQAHPSSTKSSTVLPSIPIATPLTSQPSTPFWTPNASPVLGPFKGLHIMDWSSRAGSRAGSPGPFLPPVAGTNSVGPTGGGYGEALKGTASSESTVRDEVHVKSEDAEMDVDDSYKQVHQEAPRRGYRVADILNGPSSPSLPMYGDPADRHHPRAKGVPTIIITIMSIVILTLNITADRDVRTVNRRLIIEAILRFCIRRVIAISLTRDGSASVRDEELELPPLRLPLGDASASGPTAIPVHPAAPERKPGSRLDLARIA
ncbi:uncharacterized protein EI90DRAFT_3012704 [Cantharellus anzutake]|uniref:uncharacterized protein n=1 Tax=Cantharellus anzutake TaxID=1750568 RepID=UPI001905AD75|nr:uncharacterized protein EI90DRAFT_3012704 [Cantharellus anzutake]KAF8339755.1 hypothetical protein EI90DRAFT_3012704 [Cantharellus anzutake]